MFVSALAFFGALFMTWNPTDQFDPPTGGLNEAKSGGKIPTSATLQSVASQMWTENVPDQMQSKEQEKDWNGGGGGGRTKACISQPTPPAMGPERSIASCDSERHVNNGQEPLEKGSVLL